MCVTIIRMKTIQLTQNKITIIDDEDFELISQYKWYYGNRYALSGSKIKGKQCTVYMHRLVMNAQEGDEVDHINLDKLDNRKLNLRFCTRSGNMQNSKKHKNNTSGHKGVYWNKYAKKWRAQIVLNYKLIYLGYFKNIEDAVDAYAKASKKYHKEFGRTT